jgi:ketosteroid isomerase-like protein
MSDRDEIAELVHRYCDAVCRKDAEQWAATWATDATWDLGKGRELHGRRAIVAYWLEAMALRTIVVQVAHNGEVTIDGAAAQGRWYFSEHQQYTTGETGILLAWYDDTYRHEDNRWVIATRRLTPLYSGPADLSGSFRPVT